MKSIPVLLVTSAFLLMGARSCTAQMTPASMPAETRLITPVLYVTRVAPPSEYARWYADTERCVGLKGNYQKVRWYMAPSAWTGPNGITYGMWQDGHRITLNLPEAMDSTLVMHEAMHDILAVNDLDDPKEPHPPAYFGADKCVFRFHK
jgi:hypothetical protein